MYYKSAVNNSNAQQNKETFFKVKNYILSLCFNIIFAVIIRLKSYRLSM